MTALFANAAVPAAVLLLLGLPSLRKPANIGWLLLAVALVFADLLVTWLPAEVHALRIVFPASHWNWTGKTASLAVGIIGTIALLSSRRFTWREIGLALRQAPGTGRVLLVMVVPLLLLAAAAMAFWFGDKAPASPDAVGFEAMLPGLVEELVYRGVLLALFDRLFPGRFGFVGAEIGYGAIAVSVLFGVGHAIFFDDNLRLHAALLPGVVTGIIGFFLAWLRLRTQSLVLPVVLHNVINVIFVAVPKLV